MPKTPAKPEMTAPERATPSPARWHVFVAGAALVLATAVAYHNSLRGPFVFDDVTPILENPAIRRLWPVGEIFSTQTRSGSTIGGRPLVSLSVAVNYAISGTEVWSYHVLNLLIHATAGLVLFGVVRRTLQQPVLAARFGTAALPLGLAAAGLWTLHPLQTESVTYIIQRAEALMGLCYLLTMYCFIRGVEAGESPSDCRSGFTPRFEKRGDVPSRHEAAPTGNNQKPRAGVGWFMLSFAACLLGMTCKEVMVSAPLMVFLYDRTFVAGTFREAWRRRRSFHLALAGTWLLLIGLMASTGSRGGTVGFDAGVSSWHFALTQCRAVVHYLRLSVWPHPLVFDYGEGTVKNPAEVWPQALLLIALVTGTVVALWRRPVWGFLGIWFFAILAPSSSFVPLPHQTMAEHRMYLSLIAPVVLAVTGLHVWLGRRAWWVCAALAVAGGWLTVQRNKDYRSEFALWADTLAKVPGNERAHVTLGNIYADREQWTDALAYYEQALRFKSDDPYVQAKTHSVIGDVHMKKGQLPDAIAHYKEAVRLQPDLADTHNSLGTALLNQGRTAEAIAHIEQAVRLRPEYAEAELNWATALMLTSHFAEAIPHIERTVRLKPDLTEAELLWAAALLHLNRFPEAFPHFDKAIALKPDAVDSRNGYGRALAHAGRFNEAVAQYEAALRLDPNNADTHMNLALALRQLGRMPEAAQHQREALRLNPKLAPGK